MTRQQATHPASPHSPLTVNLGQVIGQTRNIGVCNCVLGVLTGKSLWWHPIELLQFSCDQGHLPCRSLYSRVRFRGGILTPVYGADYYAEHGLTVLAVPSRLGHATASPLSGSSDTHDLIKANLVEMTNKMQTCRTNYYSIVP